VRGLRNRGVLRHLFPVTKHNTASFTSLSLQWSKKIGGCGHSFPNEYLFH
jgi:hypothetical protein